MKLHYVDQTAGKKSWYKHFGIRYQFQCVFQYFSISKFSNFPYPVGNMRPGQQQYTSFMAIRKHHNKLLSSIWQSQVCSLCGSLKQPIIFLDATSDSKHSQCSFLVLVHQTSVSRYKSLTNLPCDSTYLLYVLTQRDWIITIMNHHPHVTSTPTSRAEKWHHRLKTAVPRLATCHVNKCNFIIHHYLHLANLTLYFKIVLTQSSECITSLLLFLCVRKHNSHTIQRSAPALTNVKVLNKDEPFMNEMCVMCECMWLCDRVCVCVCWGYLGKCCGIHSKYPPATTMTGKKKKKIGLSRQSVRQK